MYQRYLMQYTRDDRYRLCCDEVVIYRKGAKYEELLELFNPYGHYKDVTFYVIGERVKQKENT